MRYKLTDKGCRARPSAIQNIQSWGKVRPLLENEGIVSADRLNHACADHDYDGVTEGWDKYYWKPWRAYLESGETT